MKRLCTHTSSQAEQLDQISSESNSVCPVQQALKILDSARASSCGRGAFCRNGLTQLWLCVRDVSTNRAQEDELEHIEKLCNLIILGDDCELSAKAASLILLSLDVNYLQWRDHVLRKTCQTNQCLAYKKAQQGKIAYHTRRKDSARLEH